MTAKWYVDPNRGNDSNDGRSQETPIKTFGRLGEVLGVVTEDTEIHLLSDGTPGDPFTFPAGEGAVTISVLGDAHTTRRLIADMAMASSSMRVLHAGEPISIRRPPPKIDVGLLPPRLSAGNRHDRRVNAARKRRAT
jgi:hypothetical protein